MTKPKRPGDFDATASSWFSPIEEGAITLAEQPPAPRAWMPTTQRLWQGFATARMAVAVSLMALYGFYFAVSASEVSRWLILAAGLYFVSTVVVRVMSRPRLRSKPFDRQWLPTLATDVIVYSALNHFQIGNINYAPLLALPVLMAAALGSQLLSMATPAAITLLLLANALDWDNLLHGGMTAQPFFQAGLTGLGLFILALFTHQLTVRLAREEQLLQRSRSEARAQTMVNELVIENLSDGVLVVDRKGMVKAANPSARQLIGDEQPAPAAPFLLEAVPAWQPVRSLAMRAFAQQASQFGEVCIAYPGLPDTLLRVRTQLTPALESPKNHLCVMFLQDLRESEARLRTEKLAAMGRMSAAVAHEIRNPLAAITQANELLHEELNTPTHQRLSAMIGQNAQRLAQIVDDILDIARVRQTRTAQPQEQIRLDARVAADVAEWQQTRPVGQRLALDLQADELVYFAPEHFRRVLVNLLDNANRYATKKAASIQVVTRRNMASGRINLHVWSDGEPIERSVQQHLFEPFFSSESRSTGLGLFMCRELCERHGATIGYKRTVRLKGAREAEGNEFWIQFYRPGALATEFADSFQPQTPMQS